MLKPSVNYKALHNYKALLLINNGLMTPVFDLSQTIRGMLLHYPTLLR